MRLIALVALFGSLLLAAGASAAVTAPVYDAKGRLVDTPFAPESPEPRLDEQRAIDLALAFPKIRDWVDGYPQKGLTENADFEDDKRVWTVKVWSDRPDAGQIVLARVDDETGKVTEAWTGPQVAWGMARGYKGLFGRQLNEPWFWFPLCAVFFVGLADLRRLRSLRNLDLLVLLSFTASWWFFNRGEPFTSVPLVYPPLLYLLGRMAWVGFRGRAQPGSRPVWPIWVLVAATVFLFGFRTTLNLTATRPNVIDVGYAGVVGAQRIAGEGRSPYGSFPVEEGEECGTADSYGRVRDRVQTNGRCESAIGNGDTYGPVTYLAYVPGFAIFGWEGKWDELPAAHLTTLMVDALVLLGLALVGRRFGGARLAATLPFAWAAFPFTQYVSNTNSNDALMPLLLVWGFLFVTSAPARGLFVGLAGWAKFAALLLVPLWASFPNGLKRPKALVLFAGGFLLATLLAFWVLLLEPDPLHAARVFWDRTFGYQLDRETPWSLWDWGVYPGYPDLKIVQQALEVVAIVAALLVGFLPKRKSPLQLAALTAAVLLVFQLTLSYWFYTYIPWFVPFVAFALFAPAIWPPERSVPEEHDRETRELVGAPS